MKKQKKVERRRASSSVDVNCLSFLPPLSSLFFPCFPKPSALLRIERPYSRASREKRGHRSCTRPRGASAELDVALLANTAADGECCGMPSRRACCCCCWPTARATG